MNKYCLIIILFFIACGNEVQEESVTNVIPKKEVREKTIPKKEIKKIGQTNRTEIISHIKQRIENNEDLFVHVFVPLCDNEHQGIVPVNKTLGDGFNPRTNLYWGALYGVKTHFKKQNNWKLIHQDKLEDNPIVLERVIFEKRIANRKIFLVADAYRGDEMKNCLTDFMQSVSGKTTEKIQIGNQNIGINGHADLLIFNGHNGLMDVEIPYTSFSGKRHKDVVAIACASHGFFTGHLEYAGGYPILMTTNLLAPEAYVLENVISEWARGTEGKSVADAAGHAYNEYQNCGYKGARRLFKSGW